MDNTEKTAEELHNGLDEEERAFLKERLKIDKEIPRSEWTVPMYRAFRDWLAFRNFQSKPTDDSVQPTTTPGAGDVVESTTTEHRTETFVMPKGAGYSGVHGGEAIDFQDIVKKAVKEWFEKNGINDKWEVSDKPKKNKERFECCDCAWNCFVLETGIKAGGVLNEEGRLRAFINWLFEPYQPKDN